MHINTDTSATGNDRGWNPGRGVDQSGSTETTNGASRRSIGDEVRECEGLDKGGDTRKGPRQKTVVKTRDCDKYGITREVHPDGTDMDKDGANS